MNPNTKAIFFQGPIGHQMKQQYKFETVLLQTGTDTSQLFFNIVATPIETFVVALYQFVNALLTERCRLRLQPAFYAGLQRLVCAKTLSS